MLDLCLVLELEIYSPAERDLHERGYSPVYRKSSVEGTRHLIRCMLAYDALGRKDQIVVQCNSGLVKTESCDK
jgi:hypothetical protein